MVSIIIPVYNNYQYLYEALDSVLVQDYFGIQLIISDDASKDFPESGVKEYLAKKKADNISECVVLAGKENVGTVKNMNRALHYVKGDYVIPLAADDAFYDEKAVSNYVKAFEEIDDSYDVVITQVGHFDKELKKLLYYVMEDFYIELIRKEEQANIFEELCKKCFFPAVGSAYKRDLFIKEGNFDERYVLIEDWPFYFRLVCDNIRFYYSDFVSVKHRDGGISHSTRNRYHPLQVVYRNDMYNVIKNEIIPNYKKYAPHMKKRVVSELYDKIVLHEFIYFLKGNTLSYKIKWFINNPRILFALARVLRRRFFKTFIK